MASNNTKDSKAFNVVRGALKSYDDEAETWKVYHDHAMKCYDFEDFLGVGIALFDGITDFDERHRARVLANEVEYDPEHSATIKDAYRWWLRPCEHIQAKIDSLRADFGILKNAEEFLSRCREAKGILMEDAEFFTGETFIELRDEALDEFRAGNSIERSWR